MKCLICNAQMEYFFSKSYDRTPYQDLMKDVGDIEYFKCTYCGMVLSKTHADLSHDKWLEINNRFHHFHENEVSNINQPPYIHQATMLKVLSENKIIDLNSCIDYAGGYATLSKILKKYFNLCLPVYDPYVRSGDFSSYVDKESLSVYKTVINSALFEHLFYRQSFDAINSLVSNDAGVMVIHTVICETIPRDPDWFYLEPPVHTTFHTNKSMEILMKEWGYQSSIYCLAAKSWVLLKTPAEKNKAKVNRINSEFQEEYLILKEGFVDYWKGF